MSDVEQLTRAIQRSKDMSALRAVSTIDDNPDDAAESLRLSADTGVPAIAIQGDIESFRAKRKAQLAGEIVRNNPMISAYVQANPLAASVSNDDWGSLDEASQSAGAFMRSAGRSTAPAIGSLPAMGAGAGLGGAAGTAIFPGIGTAIGAIGGAIAGGIGGAYGVSLLQDWVISQMPEAMIKGSIFDPEVIQRDQAQNPMASFLGSQAPFVLTMKPNAASIGTRAVSAGGNVGLEAGQELWQEGTVDPTKLAIAAGIGATFANPNIVGSKLIGAGDKLAAMAVKARPWLEAGKEPPRGIDPEIDSLKAQRNDVQLEALNEALKSSTKSLTRERSPEMFAEFMRQHLQNGKIGINAEGINALYGDKVPTPDDGILGWVPGIEDQLRVARETGGDVQVPIADWLARVEPEVARALQDDIRVSPGNITKREVVLEKDAQITGAMPELVVARKMPDGTTRYGKPGQIHADLIDPAELEQRPYFPPAKERMGFAEPGGEFLSRDQALARTKEREPERAGLAHEQTGLQAEKYNSPIDSPLAITRSASALEPMFSIGDRKLALQRLQAKEGARFGPSEGFHDFTFVDENGNTVGSLNISAKESAKELYVEEITGVNGLGPRDFGPSLMLDLKRQLKAEFPWAEWLVGHRVSGTREKLGTYDRPSAMVRVRLDALDAADKDLLDSLQEQTWRRENWAQGLSAEIKPTEFFTTEEKRLSEIALAEVRRIAGEGVEVHPVFNIRQEGLDKTIRGSFITYRDLPPAIIYDLAAPGQTGSLRHEAMHYLREYGFFTDSEWKLFENTAKKEDWFDRYNINKRYDNLADSEALIEEAVAERFRDWKAEKESLIGRAKERLVGESAIDKVFRKLDELIESLRAKFKEIFGRELTAEDLFEKIDSGEIKDRGPGVPRNAEAFRLMAEERNDMLRANTLGLDLPSFKRLQKLIEQRHAEDVEAATKRALKEQTKLQSDEWRKRAAEMRPEVVEDIKSRPSIAADLFLNSGELFGQKFDHYRILRESLTKEQEAALPDHYMTTNKLSPTAQDIADATGHTSVDSLIASLNGMRQLREQSKKSGDLFRRALIDAELQKRMEAEYGLLEENVMQEAERLAKSETQIDILIEEYKVVAEKIGGQPITKEALRVHVDEQFDKLRMGDISSSRYMDALGRLGRATDRAWAAQDFQQAARFMEQRTLALMYAKRAEALEDAKANLNKTAKRFQRAEVKGIEPEFTDHIQSLLLQAGYKLRATEESIARGIEFHGTVDLPTFVAKTIDTGFEPEVAPWILEKGAKPIEEMTVAEFDDFKTAIDTLNFIGKRINKVEIEGRLEDYKEWKKGVLERITSLPPRSREGQGNIVYEIGQSLYKTENILRDLDLGDPLGPLSTAVTHMAARSKTKSYDLLMDLKAQFDAAKGNFDKNWQKGLANKIEQNIFHDPHDMSGGLYDFDREMLLNVMLHWGTKSNKEKMTLSAFHAKYRQRPTKEQAAQFQQIIEGFIHQHATKLDWDFAQNMWNPFKKLQAEGDVVARNTNGKVPNWLPPEAIDTPFGRYEGGFWPIDHDPLASSIGIVKEAKGLDEEKGLMGSRYARLATNKGYLKDRTGYVGHIDITGSIEQAAGRMQQMIHDIAYRDTLIQAQKIFTDPDIMQAITSHYGKEFSETLMHRMKLVAYQFPNSSPGIRGWERAFAWTRKNLVSHTLPFSPAVHLTPDIGVPNPAAWVRFLADKTRNVEFAMTKSNEIRHMVYNLDRDYNDIMASLQSKPGFSEFKKKAIEAGFYIPMKMSQFFRMSTFTDSYAKARKAGKSDSDAILIADADVRTRHGDQSMFGLPPAFNSNEGMKMLTIFGGFFNTQLNWALQIPGQYRRGEYKAALATVMGTFVTGAAMNAAIMNRPNENESWYKYMAKQIAAVPFQMVPGAGAAYTWVTEGFQPRMPWVSIAKSTKDAAEDIAKMIQRKEVKKPISHTANVVGMYTGLPLAYAGRLGQFTYDAQTGKQRPRTPYEWWKGIQTGEARPRN